MTSRLRSALIANAVVSLATGGLMLVAPGAVSSWLGLDIAGWLRLFGIVLIGHAVLIAVLLPRLGIRQTSILNLMAIGAYPLLMVGVVVGGFIERPLGQALALADGALIGGIAVMHLVGLRNPDTSRHPQVA